MATQVSQQTTESDVAARTSTNLSLLHWTAIGLAAITGVIHLYLFVIEDWLPFLLAGVAFFGAIALFVGLPAYRRYLYVVGIPFTLAQIGGYLLFPMGPLWLGVLDKVVQVAFVAVLAYLYVRERKQTPDAVTAPA